MIYLDLILNLSLLVALTIVSGFIERHAARHHRARVFMQGLLFGGAAVLGMLRPLVLSPGLIFDGRSVMVSLCALFYGPWAGAISAVMPGVCRVIQGGPGAVTGVLVILSSATIGLIARAILKPELRPPSVLPLYLFGLVVHLAMVALMLTLPGKIGWSVIQTIGLPVMILYPLATILAGQLLSDQTTSRQRIQALKESEEKFRLIAENTSDGIVVFSADRKITYVSPSYHKQLGYSEEEELGRGPSEIFAITHPDDRDDLYQRVFQAIEQKKDHLLYTYRIRHKLGHYIWREDHASFRYDQTGQLVGTYVNCRDITQQKEAEQALLETRDFLESLIDSASAPIIVWDEKFSINRFNRAFEKLTGRTAGEVIGQDPSVLFPADQVEASMELVRKTSQGEDWQAVEITIQHCDGSLRTVLWNSANIRDAEGHLIATIAQGIDITERNLLEAQLLQAQKMESVGRLAGGVAHDFNNMLNVILGYTELVLESLGAEHPHNEHLLEIRMAAQRSANLTRQLLAFARKQTIAPEVLTLNETIEGMLKMLQRLIGEDVELVWRPHPTLWSVKMDPSQVDQILANLCVNSRDAITGVGQIVIETDNSTLTAVDCEGRVGVVPGEYVMLSVCDNGCGMDAETCANSFEPFYTTKGVGEGTGLGLATVYGIVTQNHGWLDIASQVGKGTTIRIYLPRHVDPSVLPNEQKTPTTIQRGNETILVVEDEPAILKLAVTMLETLGYTVRSFSFGDDLIEYAESHPDEAFDLVIADVIMPRMNGRELVDRLTVLRPGLKHLFMSGYTASTIAQHGVLDRDVHFVQKPFNLHDLAAKVRNALDRS